MKVNFANYPTELAGSCGIGLKEKLDSYKKEIDSIFKNNSSNGGYYENRSKAENHVKEVIIGYAIHQDYAKKINDILISALNIWINDVRNYELANNGYISAQNEAALTLKKQIDEFTTSFDQHL